MRSLKAAFCGVLLAAGCGDAGGEQGDLRIQLSAEDTITGGLEVGPAPEQTRDCGVSYSRFLVAIGRVKLGRRAGETRADDTVYIADMKQVGEQGVDLVTLPDLKSGQWDAFGFATPAASAGAKLLGNVAPADAQTLIDKGLTYWIDGTVSCPERSVSFSFQVAVPTEFYDCESDGEPGVAVGSGGTSTATITLHGDHLWFDSLVSSGEGTVQRRAAWILKADADGDGKVVTEDLAALRAEDAFPSSLGYNLSGGLVPVTTALDFVRVQLATQGHVNGEGECQWRSL